MESKINVVMAGPASSRSGYGDHFRDIARSIIANEKYDLKILDLPWGQCSRNAIIKGIDDDIIDRIVTENLKTQPDVFIQVSVPNEFKPIGRYNIGITAGVESTACAAEWLLGLNRMQLILVPSKFTKEVFEATTFDSIDERTKQKNGTVKCTTPIEVLFEGVDIDKYYTTDDIPESVNTELNKIPEKDCFLFVGHWLSGDMGEDRKNIGNLIRTFLETFKNKNNQPALILKTSGATFSIMDKQEILKRINAIKKFITGRLPNIYLLHGQLSDEEMNGLYNHPKVKAHISLTRGEGFGRPLAEACMSGKPVIATNWSGHVDFLNPQHTILLPGQLTDVHASVVDGKIFIEGAKWFTVNYANASKAMMMVLKDYKMQCAKAKRQHNIIRDKFNLNIMKDQLHILLDKYIPKIPKLVPLTLPKLKKIEV